METSIEERSMQAAPPQTAKKQSSIPAEMGEFSKQLEHQMQEARQTMEKMKQSMATQNRHHTYKRCNNT